MTDDADRTPVTTDAWVSRDEAIELTGFSRGTLYRRIAEESWATRPSGQLGANGRPIPTIAVSSLPKSAQALYWSRHLTAAVAPSPADPLNLAEIPDGLRVEARRRLSILDQAAAIFSAPRGLRDAALAEFCRERELSPSTVYRWHRLFTARGVGALLPQWGKTRRQFLALSSPIQQFIREQYCSPTRPTPTAVYRSVESLCAVLREPVPSQTTVNRFLLTLPQPAVVLAREGHRAFRAKMEPKCVRDLNASAPNDVWCGDHREFDVFIRTHDAPDAKIFRPWVTCWYDLGTRTWTGIHVALVPNSGTIALALRAGILRFGVPRELYIDNGKDYRCHYLNGMTQTSRRVSLSTDVTDALAPGVLAPLGIVVRHAHPYQPWSKPIEPAFKHCFTDWERTLPGWCGRNAGDRPEKLKQEIAQGALLTREQFTAQIHAQIDAYHRREHGQLGCTPLAKWEGVAIEQPSPRTLDVLLMRQSRVKVFAQGIKHHGRVYWHDALIDHIGHTVDLRFGAELGRVMVFAAGAFVCEAVNEPALTMRATREDLAALHRRKKLALQRAKAQLADRRILLRSDEALADIAAQARAQKIVPLPAPPSCRSCCRPSIMPRRPLPPRPSPRRSSGMGRHRVELDAARLRRRPD